MFNKIEDTNKESLLSKKSACVKGYFQDEFIDYFCKEFEKKEVILNRGYWIRRDFFQRVSEEFVRRKRDCQIVSLGSGLDTLGFHLLKTFPGSSFKFFEVDQIDTIHRKTSVIRKTKKILQLIGDSEESSESIPVNTKNYQLSSFDLESREIQSHFQKIGIDFYKPTLFIVECVLVYLTPATVESTINQIQSLFKNLQIADYEIFNFETPFAEVLKRNFRQQNIDILGERVFLNKNTIDKLYKENHLEVELLSVREYYDSCISTKEKERVNKLEWLDEYEEFNLICGQYFFSLSKSPTGISFKDLRS
jgi:O-methyltransferase involved in polyketide biosynthesis